MILNLSSLHLHWRKQGAQVSRREAPSVGHSACLGHRIFTGEWWRGWLMLVNWLNVGQLELLELTENSKLNDLELTPGTSLIDMVCYKEHRLGRSCPDFSTIIYSYNNRTLLPTSQSCENQT